MKNTQTVEITYKDAKAGIDLKQFTEMGTGDVIPVDFEGRYMVEMIKISDTVLKTTGNAMDGGGFPFRAEESEYSIVPADHSKDDEVISRLQGGEMLGEIIKELYPSTSTETSFDLFYRQTSIPLGDILRDHFSSTKGSL